MSDSDVSLLITQCMTFFSYGLIAGLGVGVIEKIISKF